MSGSSITFSTELMQNYLQSEILAPDARFEALQTETGASLLFSVGTDSVLYVTKEMVETRSGWARFDLSTARIKADFPESATAACKDFSTAYSPGPPEGPGKPTVHLAMVVTDGANDHLYLSLDNSGADTSWTSAPQWVAFPYDNTDHPLSPLKIVGVALSEATDAEYVVVDVVRDRDPSSPLPLVSRYYIDTAKQDGFAWQAHDVATDMQVDKYSTCLGRRAGQRVDGLYTCGTINGAAQFTYQPLYNPFNRRVPASPTRLALPGNAVPDTIASCRNADNSTDLYATANGTLYRFGSGSQSDGSTAATLISSPYLKGIRRLFAAADGDNVVVWGLNGSDQVLYTACPLARVSDAGAWSMPLPILCGVEQVSPYLDQANSANTFFAHTGQSQLVKAVKSPGTSMWAFQQITLDPPVTTAPAQRFSSYTTRIVVTGSDGQPMPHAEVSLKGSSLTRAYINSLYYILGKAPIKVWTDATGVLTVVEPLNSVAGTALTVSVDGASVTINPMDKGVGRAVALDSPDKLRNAVITHPDGTTRPLVPASVSDADLTQVAQANGKLANTYRTVSTAAASAASVADAFRARAGGSPSGQAAFGERDLASSILVDAGDLFSWLGATFDPAITYVADVIEDVATQVWTFVVTFADEVYRCVLQCAEQVACAAQWLYEKIKVAAQDLLRYLEFLFDWDDIKRTKGVLINLVKTYLDHQVNEIEEVKGQFDDMIEKAKQSIGAWGGYDWGKAGTSSPNALSQPDADQSAPGGLLAHHFQGNAGSATHSAQPADPAPDIFSVLINALNNEADTISNTFHALHDLAGKAGATPLAELLRELVQILSDAVLDSAKTVINTLFDILYDLAKTAVKAFFEPIHIPVVSDILAEIGIREFSLMDAVCWVAAVPATIAYKLASGGSAPFPDGPETTFLMTAPDLMTIRSALSDSTAGEAPRATEAQFDTRPIGALIEIPQLPQTWARIVHKIGHSVSGVITIVAAPIDFLEAISPTGDNPYSTCSAALGIVSGVMAGAANVLSPHAPIKNEVIAWMSRLTTGCRILAKVAFYACGKRTGQGTRSQGAVVNAVWVIPAYLCTAWHFYELSQDPAGSERSIAIVDEVSGIFSGITRVLYAAAVNTEDEDVKAVTASAMAMASLVSAGLQIAEAII